MYPNNLAVSIQSVSRHARELEQAACAHDKPAMAAARSGFTTALTKLLDVDMALHQQNNECQAYLEALNQKSVRALEQLQRDIEAGYRIQAQLLPEDNSNFGNYVFRRRLFPAMYLSGDFVDYFSIDDRHVGFYIADVSGHDAASAFVTVMLKTLVAQYREAFSRDRHPAVLHPEQMLQHLNADFCQHDLGKHVTLFYGVLDRKDNKLTYSAGGQFPYPMLYDGTESQSLVCPGRPVGLFEDAVFKQNRIALPPQFVLVLVSDGILELLPQDSLQARYETMLRQCVDNRNAIDELTVGLDILADKHLPDDITFLVVVGGNHAPE